MEAQKDNVPTPRTLSVKQTADAVAMYETYCDKQTRFDITKYDVVQACHIGNYIIAFVRYHDFNELNGSKVLVWQGLSVDDYRLLDRMDPRFDPMSKLFAIFKPTREGYNTAVDIIHLIQDRRVDYKLYLSEKQFDDLKKLWRTKS